MGFQLIWPIFGIVAGGAFLAIPYLNLSLAVGDTSAVHLLASAIALGLVAGLFWFRGSLSKLFEYPRVRLARVRPSIWLILLLTLTVVLRVCWWLAFDGPLRSDGKTYFSLALQLVQEGSYGGKISGYAYWPPGLSLFLAPLIAIAGPQPWVTVLGNLILSCLMVFLTYRLAQASAGETAGKMASFLIAVWPNHIMSVGLASKEQLLLALMTGILLLVLRSTLAQSNRSVAQYAFGAGLLLGAATLTQPAFMLFPSLLVLLDLLRAVNLKILFLRLFCLYAGMILVVAPWTLRNYEVFGKFIPVSTNGGDVFYRSNNPLATGGYIDRGEVDLSQLGELEANQMGYKLGKEWILANPGQFLKLAINKQMLFLGDDAVGAYESLKRALGKEGIIYVFFKGLSNAYWLLIWILIFFGWMTCRQLYYTPGVMLLVLSVLYLLAIDSVFESGARHHVPLSAALAVLAALPFSRIPDKIGTQ